jgi:hypothetical protein
MVSSESTTNGYTCYYGHDNTKTTPRELNDSGYYVPNKCESSDRGPRIESIHLASH